MDRKKLRNTLFLLVLLFLIIIGIGTYWRGLPVIDHNNNDNKPSRVKIGLSLATLQEERWKRDRDYLEEKVVECGGEFISLSANNDHNLQVRQVQYFVNNKVDVLIIIPQDLDRLAEAVEIAKRAGIKVISYDRLIRNADLDLYISFDSTKVGELMAKRLTEEVPSGRYVIINGPRTDHNCYLINQGYRNVLIPLIEKHKIEIVHEKWADNWLPEKAYATISQLLLDGVGFDAVLAANDGLASGAIEALSEWRLAGKIPVTGHDADLSACQRIIEGTQLMTVYKPIRQLAYRAAELAILLAENKEIKTNSQAVFNGKNYIPAEIITPISIDQTNINIVIEDDFHRLEDIYRNIPKPVKQL
ncbi:MAG: sugar ABC transporter substrate-binding protein [Firmicutes bacterium]|nr:sugar ABC transporter substrate-binding protein [Bacillota bacterium]